jgi:His-Xaa-Ser system protein HxsD
MEPIAIAIDPKVYALDVVQRAAFRCTDIGSFEFSVIPDQEIMVRLSVKPQISADPSAFRARFHNELLDQQLRRVIADETKVERDLILAYAFSNTKLIG